MSESFDFRRLIDEICIQYEDAWTAQRSLEIGSWLLRISNEHRSELLRELLHVDLELRTKSGQAVTPEDYQTLGDKAMAIIARLLQQGSFSQRQQFEFDPTKADNQANTPDRKSRQIGPYKLLQKLGEGGMGQVWMAEQEKPVRRRVALKLIKAGKDGQSYIARFEAERQALAIMDHQNIAKVLDAGTTPDGEPYFVMELVQGIPFNKYCDKNQLSINERLELFIPVCKAVQHAHQKGIIHRDLKPSNVLVCMYDGKPVPKIIDFGLAKALQHTARLTDKTMFTEFGQVVGSLQYMSPEQAELNQMDIDTRSDIYSLGVMLYELLTGSTPIELVTMRKQAFHKVLETIREQEPPRPSARLSSVTNEVASGISVQRRIEVSKLKNILRGDLDWIVMKALEKNRTRRYETANGFAEDLNRYLTGDVVTARPPSAAYRIRKYVRRNKGLVASLASFAIVFLAAIFGISWFVAHTNIQAEKVRLAEVSLAEMEASHQQSELARDLAEKSRAEAQALAKSEQEVRLELEKKQQFNEAVNSFLSKELFNFGGNKILQFSLGDDQTDIDHNMTLGQLLEQASSKLEERKDLDPLVDAHLCWTLATNLAFTRTYDRSIALLNRAIDLQQKYLGDAHPSTLVSLDTLGVIYLKSGQLVEANRVLLQTYEMRKSKLGRDHPDTLGSMSNLAWSYQASGQLDKALPLYEQTLELWKAQFGPAHPVTIDSMNNLAAGYRAAGQLDKALSLLEQALELRKSQLGPVHPDTITVMNNLAVGYHADNKLDMSLPLFEQTLELRKSKLGIDHPDTLNSMNNLALVYKDAGRLDKALPLYEQTLEARKAIFGSDHPETLISMNELAEGYRAAGQLNKALPLYKQTLELRKAKLCPDHPDTLISINNLAMGYKAAGQLENALPLFESASVEIEKRQFQHQYAGSIITNTIEVYERAQQFDEAHRWQHKWLAFLKTKAGSESPQYAGALAGIAQSLLKRQAWKEAETVLRECLSIREKSQADLWTTFNTQSMLGASLLGQQNYDQAEPLLIAGYEGMKARQETIPTPSVKRIPEALDRLIELYTATNNAEELQKWKTEKENQTNQTREEQ